MKRIKSVLSILTALIMVFNIVGLPTVNAQDSLSYYCAIGTNSNEFVNMSATHVKRDYNGTSANWQVNNYQYVYVTANGTIDNSSGNLLEGDYFTIQLDDKIRPNGIIDKRNISAVLPVITTTGADGSSVTIAVPEFNATTNEIRYVFTSEIEKTTTVDFSLTLADMVDLMKVPNNGPQTFVHDFAGESYSYSYDIFIRDSSPAAPQNIKEASFITNVYINPDESVREFQYRSLVDIYDLPGDSEFSLTYSVTPSIDSSTIKIYGVPAGSRIDGLGYDVSTLEDVTALFTETRNNNDVTFKSTVNKAKYTNFVVEIISTFPTNLDFHVSASTQGGLIPQWSGADVQKAYLDAVANAIANQPEVPCRKVVDLEITKVDATNNQLFLPGAAFDLYEIRNNEEIKVNTDPLVTNADGKVLIEGIHYLGEYKLVEVTAPTGYELNSEPITFVANQLSGELSTAKLAVQNNKLPETTTTTVSTTEATTSETTTEATTSETTTEVTTSETTTEATTSETTTSEIPPTPTTEPTTTGPSVKPISTEQPRNPNSELPKTGEKQDSYFWFVMILLGTVGIWSIKKYKH